MKTLENLKTRLLALPGKREGRQYEARYAAFLEKSLTANVHLDTAFETSEHAVQVLPANGYKDALKAVRSASKIASRLKEKLNAEQGAILDAGTEESFIRLFENATSALKSCQSAWETELQAKIKDWEAIQDVVAKLIPAQGGRLKQAIRALQMAKGNLPRTIEVAAKIKGDLDDLKDSIAKLDLQGPFGEFLRATASPDGADLHLLLNDDVSKVIEKHKLQKVFRVRVSS